MLRTLRYPLARIGRWPRLLAVVSCLLLAALSALGAGHRDAASAAGPRQRVVVSARALPAGHTVVRRDLTVARWPTTLAPSGARAAPAVLLGRRLAGPVDAGEPITAERLVGTSLTRGLAAGTVATPIDLDMDVNAFVHVGDRVDLVATRRPDFDALESDGNSGGADSGSADSGSADSGSADATNSSNQSGPSGSGANSTRDPSDTSKGDAVSAGDANGSGSSGIIARRLLVLAVYRGGDPSAPTTQLVLATSRELAIGLAGRQLTQMFTIVADSP